MLNGHLRLVLGERDLTLRPGEAAEFDTSLPHWLGSADGGVVELLILFDPQGIRTHIHGGPHRPPAAGTGGEPSGEAASIDRETTRERHWECLPPYRPVAPHGTSPPVSMASPSVLRHARATTGPYR